MRLQSPVALLLLLTGCLASRALANDIDTLLQHDRPAGVVFEIIESREAMLGQRLLEIRRDIERLHEKFPGLAVAIVSHGREQFALTQANASRYAKTHSLVQQLVDDEDTPVHICGTHAGWFDVMPEDFPAYVDVSPSGPAQINDYEELGYELIVVGGE